MTTYYVGNYFEWTGSASTMKKYYYAGGARVAVREGSSTLYFILTDHLGSTAITVNSAGTTEVGELRYYAYGGTRYTSGATPTSRRFTGQIEDATIGLYFYNARFYDAALGRFVQADTIVPNPGNPQDWNRYSYVRNSPLNYRDPSGHKYDPGGDWGGLKEEPPPPETPWQTSLELEDDGTAVLDIVVLPPGTNPAQGTHRPMWGAGGHTWGIGIEIAEVASAITPVEPMEHVLGPIDVVAELIGSWGHGESYIGQPHPTLPRMAVIGQDALVSIADVVLAETGFVIQTAVTEGAGALAINPVDAVTSGASLYHDVKNIKGEVPKYVAYGFYIEWVFPPVEHHVVLIYSDPGSTHSAPDSHHSH